MPADMEAVYSTDMNTSVFAKMHLCKVYEKEKCFCNNNLNEQTLLSSKADKAEWHGMCKGGIVDISDKGC